MSTSMSTMQLPSESTEGLVDLKSYKQICKDLKPQVSSMTEYYGNQFKSLAIDQKGLIEISTLKRILTTMGNKMSESNVDAFLKNVKKEDGDKVKVSSLVDCLSSINVVI